MANRMIEGYWTAVAAVPFALCLLGFNPPTKAWRVAKWTGLGLMAFHPGWWLDAYGGDCGDGRIRSAQIASALIIAVGIAVLDRRIITRDRSESNR